MSQRLRIILIAFVALIVPAVILLIVVDRNPQLQNTILRVTNANTPVANTNTDAANTNTPIEDPDRVAVSYVARNFSETYGSGNNQNNFAHFEAAMAWGTDSFNEFLGRTIAQERLTTATSPYRGVVTKAIVMDITRLESGQASVTVGTQRTETIETREDTYFQDLFIDLIKTGDDWKVNAASWQPR